MDAARTLAAKGNSVGISDEQASRVELANDLRDLADQIERGARVILEYQTFEHGTPEQKTGQSFFCLRTAWVTGR